MCVQIFFKLIVSSMHESYVVIIEYLVSFFPLCILRSSLLQYRVAYSVPQNCDLNLKVKPSSISSFCHLCHRRPVTQSALGSRAGPLWSQTTQKLSGHRTCYHLGLAGAVATIAAITATSRLASAARRGLHRAFTHRFKVHRHPFHRSSCPRSLHLPPKLSQPSS